MDSLTLVACIILLFPTVFLAYALIQSAVEQEWRATKRLSIVLFLWLALLAVLLFGIGQAGRDYSLIILALLFLPGSIILLFPWPESKLGWTRGKPDRVDERNIMFSRAELISGSERFDAYYKEFPEHKAADDAFRKLSGFLKPGSSFYNSWLFGAADAGFFTVASLRSRTNGPVSSSKQDIDPEQITRFVTSWAGEMGCHSIGVTPLFKHHLYTIGGRQHNYGEPVHNSHKYAIAFTVEMDFQRIRSAPRGPVILESATQYLKSGTIAVQIADFIRSLGYDAQAHIDGKYQVRCPEVAKDAGLGELGRMSLLMTSKLGPRVRIGVVTTDLPMQTNTHKQDTSLLMFCQICKKCAEDCPSQAISHNDPEQVGGTTQWLINQEACYTYWCKAGTDCGRCIAVCPFSHPDNLLHNIVRNCIKISPLFRLFALRMDNCLYGRKPVEKDLPEWMKKGNGEVGR